MPEPSVFSVLTETNEMPEHSEISEMPEMSGMPEATEMPEIQAGGHGGPGAHYYALIKFHHGLLLRTY